MTDYTHRGEQLEVRGARTAGRVRDGLEDTGVRGKPEETHVVDNSISDDSGLAGNPLADDVVDDSGVSSENIVKGVVGVDAEDSRKEWMVAHVGADRRVVDQGLNAQGRKVARISDAG